MKGYFSIFLSVSILFSLFTFAGLGGVFATDTISITADKTVLVVGQTATLTVTLPDGAESYSVVSNDESVVSVDDDSSLLSCSALEFGSAIITATCTVNGTLYTDSITIKVRTPRGLISGKDYYVMNLQTGKFLAIPSGGDYNGAPLCGIARGTDARGKWTVEIAENGNGVTRLINVSSSSGRAMYINGSLDAVLYASTSSSVRSQIALHRVESGTYQGKYLMRYNGKFISMNSSNDVYLASSLNAGSYWTFMAVEKGSARFVNFDYYYLDSDNTHFDTSSEHQDFESYFNNKGYSAIAITNDTVSNTYNYLSTGEVFIYYGHGGESTLTFETTGRVTTGYLFAYRGQKKEESVPQYWISALNIGDLSSQRCVLYIGCLTAVDVEIHGSECNLVDMTFERGAHFVLGLTEITRTDHANAWLDGFLDAINNNNTIQSAIARGNAAVSTYSIANDPVDNRVSSLSVYTVGDHNQYLNY